MFDVLVASGAHLELTPRWVTTSVLAHALVVTLAGMATQAALDTPPITAPAQGPALSRQAMVPSTVPITPPTRSPNSPITVAHPTVWERRW